ncbi:MAG: ANTAR domain-containing protein [Lachnospiraceae bacterium]|nr:ANTAR domain-containing protein [Lachnospiraceae bacterium]MCR5767785.1 ANTAR domain-containing protein [Lachnospiraceae bacterium]
MVFDERTYSVLVVSASDKFNELASSVMSGNLYYPMIFAPSVSVAKRKLLERNYDLIIVNSPLPDETGINFAVDSCRKGNTVSLLIIKDEDFDEIHSRVASQGVFVLTKPLNQAILEKSIKWLESARERIRVLESKQATVEEKMEEIRLINKAKWFLIEQKKMSEAEAHHFIEKQAMNNSASKRDIAEKIIKIMEPG